MNVEKKTFRQEKKNIRKKASTRFYVMRMMMAGQAHWLLMSDVRKEKVKKAFKPHENGMHEIK